LRENLPDLLTVAGNVRGRQIIGVAAYKPPNSHPDEDARVFDFIGMMGVPLVPCHVFPTNAPAAFFSVQALKDPDFIAELTAYLKTGRPTLLTDGVATRLKTLLDNSATNVQILQLDGQPPALLNLPQADVDELRKPLLAPLQTVFRAPNHVGLYLFEGGGWVVENFNSQPAKIELNGQSFTVEPRGWKYKF
jgi:hypothetical protein